MQRFIILLCLYLSVFQPVLAIQQQENLDTTIEMLCLQLEGLKKNEPKELAHFSQLRNRYWLEMKTLEEQATEMSLVMYSHRNENIFGMIYSCNKILALHDTFLNKSYPFKEWQSKFAEEIERYALLQGALERISPEQLSPRAAETRIRSIEDCKTIVVSLARFKESLAKDDVNYQRASKELNDLYEYSSGRFAATRDRIFLGSGISYLSILADWDTTFPSFVATVRDIYLSDESYSKNWIEQVNHFFLLSSLLLALSLFISAALSRFSLSGRLVPRHYLEKKNYYIVAHTMFFFSFSLLILRLFVLEKEFAIHASMLLMEFSLLVGIVFYSLCLRVPREKLFKGMMLYLPNIVLGGFLIYFRIMIVPNEVVHFLLPPVFLIASVGYLIILFSCGLKSSRTDTFYSWFSFIVIVAATVLAWVSFRFLALQLMMLWLILLTAIQVLITLQHKVERAYKRKEQTEEQKIQTVWFFVMMNKLVMPLLTIILITGACIWAAYIFDMAPFFIDVLKHNFIEVPDVASVSITKILWLINIGIITNFVLYIIKEILRSIYGPKTDTGALPVAISIGSLLVWGFYIATGLLIFEVNPSGLMVVMGGLSMGLGFAMKDTIENFICGLSLMFGRVQAGDMVECDGMRGRIASIGYRTTMLETVDGSIITFLNTQLFTKNFKNLTKNHHYEMARIPVGVAYGTNVEHARQLILEVARRVDVLHPDKPVTVNFDGFGASSVDLMVIIWVPVSKRGSILSLLKEQIYITFNEHGIKIPFPQQEVYLYPMETPEAAPENEPESKEETPSV